MLDSAIDYTKEQFCRPLDLFATDQIVKLGQLLKTQTEEQTNLDNQGWKLWAEQAASGRQGALVHKASPAMDPYCDSGK